MKNIKKELICLLIVAVIDIFFNFNICNNAFGQDVDDLIYVTEEYPPLNYTENGELKGIFVDVLKLLWEKMGYPEQKISVHPWARGYLLVSKEKNHVLFAMARTKERENLVKWVGPVTTVKYILVARTDSKIKINSIQDAMKYQIGTVREDAAEQLLKELGFDKQIESLRSYTKNFEKMNLGRIDLIALDEKGYNDLIKAKIISPKTTEIVWVIKETSVCYAFHKDTPDLLIQRFQSALDSIDAERREVLAKYTNN